MVTNRKDYKFKLIFFCMGSKIEVRVDELWTNYLIRRLREIGVEPAVFREGDGSGVYLARYSTPLREWELTLIKDFRNIPSKRITEATSYSSLGYELLTEGVSLAWWSFERDLILKFEFQRVGMALVSDKRGGPIEGFPRDRLFKKYCEGNYYRTSNVISKIVSYSKFIGLVPISVSHESDSSSVRRWGFCEGERLKELYTRAINEDVNNLRFFEWEGQRAPYVLVNSVDIWGNVGKPFENLYLVARDRAPEDWQQKIVAYHESLCIKSGHDIAKAKELSLVRALGKEKEYLAWRERIDNEK